MSLQARSLRTFIGASDYETSRAFYRDFGFEEFQVSEEMSYFRRGGLGFYLQRYYVEDWVNNSMLFLEVDDVDEYYQHVQSLRLPEKHPSSRVQPIQDNDWGREFFVHDPSGVLWHIGAFSQSRGQGIPRDCRNGG